MPGSTDQLARRAAPFADTARLSGLTAVIPVHDEEASLPGVAETLLAVLPTVADRWELVIVDDGSRDGTAGIADRLARSRRGVRVVRHERNRGYGAALRSGVTAARHDHVFWMDGDGQFDARQLPRLVERLAETEADAVVGYRVRRADPWLRRLNTAGWNLLMRGVLGLRVRDVNCAFKLVRRGALRATMPEASGAMISAEVLSRIQRCGGRIVEIPVDHLPRRAGRPSGASPRVVLRAFVELARLAPGLRRDRPTAADAVQPADV